MWCWRTFLPRCSRTFGFGESIKSPRRSPFKEISFSRWIPGSPGPSLAYRFIHEQNSSLSRTSNSIFRADSNENPKFEASAKMSSIGDRTSRPNSSSFALRWFRSNGFPCIFFSFFFLFHLWNAISKLVLLDFRVGLLSWNALRAGLVLWVVLHNFIEEFVTNYLRGICSWNSFTSYSAFTIGCITGGIGFAYITWILRKKFQFLSGDKIFFSFSLHILLVIK